VTRPSQEANEGWGRVAGGWERRRALFWDATSTLSERLVELLDPQPGETILELAAGPGDTGFLAASRLGPAGVLLSTDVVPEMVEAARHRSAELGVTNADFRVLDATAIDLPDASVDGVLCRFGLMLVDDLEAGFAEVRRVLRPGRAASIAVWAGAEHNDWMTAAGQAALALGLMERPDPEAPGPFRLADPVLLESLVAGSGLELETSEDVTVRWHAGSADEWWETVADTSPRLSALLASLGPGDTAALRAEAVERIGRYVEPDGSLTVPGLARAALARRPS
jgi:SAM-dependent methyltransferase